MGRLNVAKRFLGLVLLCGICSTAESQSVGPATGALVAVGGTMKDPAILARFLALAGGPEAPIVVIPTAGTSDLIEIVEAHRAPRHRDRRRHRHRRTRR